MLLGMSTLVPVETRLHSARHEPDTYYEVIRDRKGGVFSSVDQRYKDGYLPGKVAYYNALKPYFKNLELKLIERGGSYVIFLENPTGVMDAIEESELYGCRREADYSSSALTRPPGSTSFFATGKAFFLSPFFRQIFAILSVNLCESSRSRRGSMSMKKIKINITKLAGGWLIESCAGFSTV